MSKVKIHSRLPGSYILLIQLCCFLLLSCSYAQDQAPVTTKGSKEILQQISEGVTGQVKTRSGLAITGAMMTPASRSIDGPPIPEIAITTDEHGRYEWPLPPGSYQMSVFADGYQKYTLNVDVKAGQVTTLDFILDKHP